MLGQFKTGDTVRVKYDIKNADDIDSKYWRGIGRVSLHDILDKNLVIREVRDVVNDQEIRFSIDITRCCYPAELFELVSPRQEERMDLDPLPRKKKEKRVEVQSTRNLTV